MTRETKAWIIAEVMDVYGNTPPKYVSKAMELLESQEKEIERLKEALKFYACINNYKLWESEIMNRDRGKQAREALESK